MTTSEERHEVAERLRKRECGWRKVGTHVSVRPDMPATQFEEIAGLMGFNGWILNADIFARLADLIDPTCRVSFVEPTEDEVGLTVGWEFNLTCGHTAEMPWNAAPAYCPDCGARVVSD